jgi:NAD dependent epimerase/dehydratase family enzyme
MRIVRTPPPVWVQMSTAHIYGDPPEAICTEHSALGYGLAPTVGRAWEEEFRVQVLPTQRAVILRTSFVIGRNRGAGSGALAKLGWLARIGLGGSVGSGRQGMSWIHEADMNRIFVRALEEPTMQGTYIASSPHPVAQREFMRSLRKAVGMPFGLPAHSWLVRLAAPLLLRTDPELALYGRFVVPNRLREEGFDFHFPRLEQALADLI